MNFLSVAITTKMGAGNTIGWWWWWLWCCWSNNARWLSTNFTFDFDDACGPRKAFLFLRFLYVSSACGTFLRVRSYFIRCLHGAFGEMLGFFSWSHSHTAVFVLFRLCLFEYTHTDTIEQLLLILFSVHFRRLLLPRFEFGPDFPMHVCQHERCASGRLVGGEKNWFRYKDPPKGGYWIPSKVSFDSERLGFALLSVDCV